MYHENNNRSYGNKKNSLVSKEFFNQITGLLFFWSRVPVLIHQISLAIIVESPCFLQVR